MEPNIAIHDIHAGDSINVKHGNDSHGTVGSINTTNTMTDGGAIDTVAANDARSDAAEWSKLFGEGFKYGLTNRSNLSEACLLLKWSDGKLRYSLATGFIVYNGAKWSESELDARRVVQAFTDEILGEAERAVSLSQAWAVHCGLIGEEEQFKPKWMRNDEQHVSYEALMAAKSYEQYALDCKSESSINTVLRMVQPIADIAISDIDKAWYLLCTPDATYDLRHGMAGAKGHDMNDFITKMAACSPSNVGADIWKNALNTFFCGDAELIRYVKRVAGLACLGRTTPKSAIVAYGESSTGKTTFWRTISRVLGDYSGMLPTQALYTGNSEYATTEAAWIRGQRLLRAPALGDGARLAACVRNHIKNDGELKAQNKGKQPYSIKPCYTLVFEADNLTNERLGEFGSMDGVYLVPFMRPVDRDSLDYRYSERLFEEAGGAIMKWLIEGAHEVVALNFNIPALECVIDLVEGSEAKAA